MIKPEVPPAVRWIVRTLEDAGFETWAVGGGVRDAFLGIRSGDWDLTTRATPNRVQHLFNRTIPVGIDHGTVGVLSRDGVLYEVTTFRRDIETTGRHALVEFSDTLDEDLSRRDFTINAVAWHPLKEALHDPYGGQMDLERGLLRTVGNPKQRFAEDYLRILRALRFAGTYSLTIETETWRALTSNVARTDSLSPERIRDELARVLSGGAPPSRALALYAASGVLGILYPELDALVGCPRDPAGDWFAHSLRAIDFLSPRRPALRWAALLQGIGEPAASVGTGGRGGGPDERARVRAAALLERLRSSNAKVREVSELSARIARPPSVEADDEALRRWSSATGRAALPSLLRVWAACVRADEAFGGSRTRPQLIKLSQRLRAISRPGTPLTVAELALSGRDLIRMGYAPGPHFGEVLNHLLDRTLEEPELNDKPMLEAEARRWIQQWERSREAGGAGQVGDLNPPSGPASST